jgi:formate dehydrogenase alpha subunit
MVEVEGPPRRMLPACTTPAAEGMSVLSMTPVVVQARKDVLELLLINHPLDCPVCDKAGECRLQDLVHEYGLGPGVFSEKKRTTPPDRGSPVIARNQDRCILCGKCVRACTERCGVGALAFSGRGSRSRISSGCDGPLNCEFCGECVEICPVGALTARQFTHRSRPWNLERTPSTCVSCGCGCPVTLETLRGTVVRARSRDGHYLCAQGRFGWDAAHHESRLLSPKMRVGGALVDCSWEEALSVIATNLAVVRNRRGARSIGGLGSVRTGNEENYLFQKFLRTVVGTHNVDMLARLKLPHGLNAAYFADEIAAIGKHDVIILLEPDAGEVNPLTGVEIVHAVNGGGSRLILAGGGRNKFNRIASVVIPQEPDRSLETLAAALRGTRRPVSTATKQAVELLRSAASVAVILPLRHDIGTYGLARELASLLPNVAYYPVVGRGNIQGALDMGVMPDYYPGYQKVGPETTALLAAAWNATLPESPGMTAVDMLQGMELGTIGALYIMGDDPVGSDPGLASSLRRLEFLVVQDIFLTETAKLADVVLPAASSLEKSGTVTTIDRRILRFAAAEKPPGEAKPDGEIIQALARRMGSDLRSDSTEAVLREIRAVVPLYERLAIGSRWPAEQSPLNGTIADLSLSSDSFMAREVISAGRLLFSSGVMMTRSKEIRNIIHRNAASPGLR